MLVDLFRIGGNWISGGDLVLLLFGESRRVSLFAVLLVWKIFDWLGKLGLMGMLLTVRAGISRLSVSDWEATFSSGSLSRMLVLFESFESVEGRCFFSWRTETEFWFSRDFLLFFLSTYSHDSPCFSQLAHRGNSLEHFFFNRRQRIHAYWLYALFLAPAFSESASGVLFAWDGISVAVCISTIADEEMIFSDVALSRGVVLSPISCEAYGMFIGWSRLIRRSFT